MNKIPVGYGYCNNRFEVEDFYGKRLRPLVIDTKGRRFRGRIRCLLDKQVEIELADRSIQLSASEVSFVGDPRPP